MAQTAKQQRNNGKARKNTGGFKFPDLVSAVKIVTPAQEQSAGQRAFIKAAMAHQN